MEKLTLKHLAAYLPYDVELHSTDKFLNLKGYYLNAGKGICGINTIIEIDIIKLKLHPLSKLTREIEHNKKRFVPIEKLLNDIKIAWDCVGLTYPNDKMGLYEDIINNIKSCEYWMIKKLFEWHFDVFGLIDKGLAIEKQ